MDEKDIEEKVKISFRSGAFLTSMLAQRQEAGKDDEDYLSQVVKTAAFFRKQFDDRGLLKSVEYSPTKFWKELNGKRLSFVDGGVAAANLPNAIPFAVRVGAYSVLCGDDSEQRESFSFPHFLVDEVYAPSGKGWDSYNDPSRVCDATRMLLEICTAVDETKNQQKRDFVCVHGPLVNPVAPYGLEGFPELSEEMFNRLFRRSPADSLERGFVGAYKLAVENCFAAPVPVAGVVERDSGSMQFLESFLFQLPLGDSERRRQRDNLESYGLSDSRLLSYVLAAGEYVGPLEIRRQGSRGKWPRDWEFTLEEIPNPSVYFLLSSESALPLRVELNPAAVAQERSVIRTLHHVIRLLPNYVFPVGLHIVDQFAKIPRWLHNNVRDQYATQLLLKAIATKDPNVIGFAKRVVLSKGRDWFLRPKS